MGSPWHIFITIDGRFLASNGRLSVQSSYLPRASQAWPWAALTGCILAPTSRSFGRRAFRGTPDCLLTRALSRCTPRGTNSMVCHSTCWQTASGCRAPVQACRSGQRARLCEHPKSAILTMFCLVSMIFASWHRLSTAGHGSPHFEITVHDLLTVHIFERVHDLPSSSSRPARPVT